MHESLVVSFVHESLVMVKHMGAPLHITEERVHPSKVAYAACRRSLQAR